MFKTVRQNFSAIGGCMYRLTNNGEEVRIEERSPNAKTYRVVVEMPLSVYETICEETRHDTTADTWLYKLSQGVA